MLRSLNLRTTVNREWLLAKLHENRENRDHHGVLYAEAVDGFKDRARATLEHALAKVGTGKVADISVSIRAPEDHTREYDTVIGMITNHVAETMELSADEYRMFVEDLWDWSESWYVSNAVYSASIATESLAKGY